jgi:3-hydroxyacyl-CoA dehydrogenase
MVVGTIAVIGAGAAGREVAGAAALGGYKTILEDVSTDVLERACDWIRGTFEQRVTAGHVEGDLRDAALRSLSTAGTVEDALREANLIIETLPEEMEMKIELFTIFDKFARPNAIFASNSAALSITEMAEVTFCAERCIGMRFDRNGGIELVKGAETSEETVAACSEVGRRMGKTVMVVRDSDRSIFAGAEG